MGKKWTFPIFFIILLHFVQVFLNLVVWMGDLPTQEGPGYATWYSNTNATLCLVETGSEKQDVLATSHVLQGKHDQ